MCIVWLVSESWSKVRPWSCSQLTGPLKPKKIGHSSHNEQDMLVTSAGQNEQISQEHHTRVLKGDPHGFGIFAPHSILMGMVLSSLGPSGVFPVVLEGRNFCTATLINPTFEMSLQWSEACTDSLDMKTKTERAQLWHTVNAFQSMDCFCWPCLDGLPWSTGFGALPIH